jgi:pyruvate,water dikinase
MKLLVVFVQVSILATGVRGFSPRPVVRRKPINMYAIFEKQPVAVSNKKSQNEPPDKYCIPLEDIRLEDLPKVGGKTASLGELIQQLVPLGVKVPGGFGVSSTAYDAVLDRFELRERLKILLSNVDGKVATD